MKHKVVALDTYSKRGIKDLVLGFIPEENYEFEVDDERLKVLLGENYYHVAFVKEVKGKAKETIEGDITGLNNSMVEAEEVYEESVENKAEKATKKKSKKK